MTVTILLPGFGWEQVMLSNALNLGAVISALIIFKLFRAVPGWLR